MSLSDFEKEYEEVPGKDLAIRRRTKMTTTETSETVQVVTVERRKENRDQVEVWLYEAKQHEENTVPHAAVFLMPIRKFLRHKWKVVGWKYLDAPDSDVALPAPPATK